MRYYLVNFLLLISISAYSQSDKRQDAQFHFENGEKLFDKELYADCIAAFTESLKLDESLVEAYYWRALARERLQQWSFALSDYSTFILFAPQHAEALFNRGQLHFRLGQYQQAKQDFLLALSQSTAETSTVFFRQQAFSGEVDQLFTAHKSNQSFVFTALGLAETKLENYSAAIIAFDSALKHQPRSADLYVNRGLAFQKSEQTDRAIEDYQRALMLSPGHLLARKNLEALQQSYAMSDFALMDSAVANNPHLPYAYAERGHAYLSQKKYKQAIDDYTKAIKINDKDPDYFLNRGLAYDKLHQYQEAYNDYTKALTLKEDYALAWLNRGNVLLKLKKEALAIEDYSAAITFEPEYAAAYYNRCLAYYRLKQHKAACSDLHTAKRLGQALPSSLEGKVCINTP